MLMKCLTGKMPGLWIRAPYWWQKQSSTIWACIGDKNGPNMTKSAVSIVHRNPAIDRVELTVKWKQDATWLSALHRCNSDGCEGSDIEINLVQESMNTQTDINLSNRSKVLVDSKPDPIHSTLTCIGDWNTPSMADQSVSIVEAYTQPSVIDADRRANTP